MHNAVASSQKKTIFCADYIFDVANILQRLPHRFSLQTFCNFCNEMFFTKSVVLKFFAIVFVPP